MPVNGPKIESKCLAMCSRVEPFLGFELLGKGQEITQHFWQELASDHEAVSNYIVCLIAKLISLDSEHGLKPLISSYRDLVELPVDHSKYKAWSHKPIPANARAAALELQHSIISTIYFLTTFYSYRPTIHLRHMYLRWNLARNYSGDGSRKLADSFEEKVISPFSVAQSKDLIIHSPPSSLSQGERGEEGREGKVLCQLIDECSQNHHRAFLGVLPPEVSKLCVYSAVSEALSYIQLRHALSSLPSFPSSSSPSSSPSSVVVSHVLSSLRKEAAQGLGQDQGDREGLLPLLQLLKDFITMMLPVDRSEAYLAIMPFYMWPVPHAEACRRVMDLLVQEGKVRGTSFRRKLLVEANLGFKMRKTEIRGQFVHMLVDDSNPVCHGDHFSKVFLDQRDLPSSESLYRLIIRNCFKSVDPAAKMVELETSLRRLSATSLKSVCLECLEAMEEGVGGESRGDEIHFHLTQQLNQIRKRIVQETESEEQRDSAVSCSSLSGFESLTEDALSSFSLPPPHLPTHPLTKCQLPTVRTKMREILITCQNQLTPETAVRKYSRSSATSMDSTGSGHLERVRNGVGGGGGVEGVTNGHVVVEGGEGTSANGDSGYGEVGIVESREEEVTTPDSGHVMSPEFEPGHVMPPDLDSDRVTSPEPVTPPPTDEIPPKPKQRSFSADMSAAPCLSSMLDQNGDTSPTASDSVFHAAGEVSPETGHAHPRPETRHSISQPADDSAGLGGQPRPRTRSHRFVRHKTIPANMTKRMSDAGNIGPLSPSSSVIGHTPLYGTTRRNYTNVAGGPQAPPGHAIPLSSLNVTGRRNTMSIPLKRRVPLAGAGSPLHVGEKHVGAGQRVLKIVLAGGDLLISHAARAYVSLMMEEPNLFLGLDVRFYPVPLSTASGADWQVPERNRGVGGGDLPDMIMEKVSACGYDVNIGRYMGHLDSWYERNVVLAVHHTLRLLPEVKSYAQSTTYEENSSVEPSLTPSKVLIDTVTHYCREANHCIKAKMYKLKVNFMQDMRKPLERSHKIRNKEVYMLHRMNIQRLSGKKNNRQVKPFDVNLQMTELSLDGSFVRGDIIAVREVWSVRATNIPQANDTTAPNPESECVELTVMKLMGEAGRFSSSKSRPTEESHHHIYELVVETKKDPLTVMVDGDRELLLENVIRLELSPVYRDDIASLAYSPSSSSKPDSRTDRHLFFPLMTFWPVDL